MAGLTLKGELKFKGEVVTIKDNFTKREFWIEIDQDTQYPQIVNLELIKDKCDIIDKYTAATKTTKGDMIEADINVRGNVAKMADDTYRCFNSLNCWRVRGIATGEKNDAPMPGEEQAAAPAAVPEAAPAAAPGGVNKDDLPF
jgi:hypothetical protein